MASTNNTKHKFGTIDLSRDTQGPFEINDKDLSEHFYIIGRSGSGKTNLLLNLALADIKQGRGICFIDPIGDAAETLLTLINSDDTQLSCLDTTEMLDEFDVLDASNIPDTLDTSDMTKQSGATKPPGTLDTAAKISSYNQANRNSRDKEIIYFNAADTDYPIGFNPLYNVAPQERPRAVSDILQMFESIWHDSGWGPRMESIFRAALHTLIENPNCSRPSLLSVFRLLLDQDYRHQIKQDIKNPQLLDWWNLRFDRSDLNERTRREWIEPVLNKIDRLSLDPVIRNIIGQPRTILDIDQVIARKQILIINLAQSKIGLDNASFLGMLLISKIRQAAAKEGSPNKPFHLTIDEAHTFPTTELTKIITQGRHFGLYSRICHQHLEQFDAKLASSLRNGCGSLAVFAVGSRDGEVIVDDLEALSRDRTLNQVRNLANGETVLRLTVNGAPQPPSSYAIKMSKIEKGSASIQSAINFTRERYGTDRLTAEFQIELERGDMTKEQKLIWMAKLKQQDRSRQKARKSKSKPAALSPSAI